MEPLGITHLEFAKSGNHYTWRKVKTVVHNIVIGKLWIDQVRRGEGWKVKVTNVFWNINIFPMTHAHVVQCRS